MSGRSSVYDGVLHRIDLAIVRVDVWAVMKVSFLLSIVLSIAMIIDTVVLRLMVDGMHVSSTVEGSLKTIGA